QADARVATGRLDHRLSRLEHSASFGILDDAEREAVLHGAERVERFELDEQLDAVGSEPADPNDWRVADCLEDAGESGHRSGACVRAVRVNTANITLETLGRHVGAAEAHGKPPGPTRTCPRRPGCPSRRAGTPLPP